uniref:DUF1002 domain-containing protein n=1 Tax=Priestia taiwanensis TaxID=1347902 RepID=A0A917ELT9_9BACI|nr:DUF1002 domain-containing protein [Priestia taiwanensis]MBM7361490.1 uncharacterized protein YpuA (DUF1002 family) [Priestia taiwanensis]GGE54601.1 hypothetical protein GCM10007140_01120 [Priestia taiwanensis]
MFKKLTALALAVCITLLPLPALADVVVGESIVTLGENLSTEQKNQVLKDMNAPQGVQTITVSNQEEHKYLGDVIPKSQIGTRAISSAMITYTKKGTGVVVKTNNINWVEDNMYASALVTAGLKDAEIYITSPFPVSGTAALTGIMKAYETSTNTKIDDEVKIVANKEMVTTAELGESIGNDQAVQFISEVKKEIAAEQPQTKEEVQSLIQRLAEQFNLTLSDEQLKSLVDLFNSMKDINIDWKAVGEGLNNIKGQVTGFLESEEGKSFFAAIGDFFSRLFDAIGAFFKTLFS